MPGSANRDESNRPTLGAVAELAGVSSGTASQALSGNAPVSAAARDRVLAAAAELGYVVNGVARALRTRASLMLGMVVPEVSNPYFADLMAAIEDCCRVHGLAVLFGASANDSARELDYVHQFRERQVDGLLLVGAQETKRIEALLPAGYPVVAVDRVPEGWSHDLVAVDVRSGVELAVAHLVSLGHERLAFLGGQSAIGVAASRRDQFLRACEGRAIVTAVSEGEFTLASGLLQAGEVLAAGDPPTAIVAANDLLALGAISAAQQRGIRVPEDLSVVGFDDSSIAGAVSPDLTTIHQPVEQIAAQAVAAVLSRIESPRRRRVAKWLLPELVVRGSTAPKI